MNKGDFSIRQASWQQDRIALPHALNVPLGALGHDESTAVSMRPVVRQRRDGRGRQRHRQARIHDASLR